MQEAKSLSIATPLKHQTTRSGIRALGYTDPKSDGGVFMQTLQTKANSTKGFWTPRAPLALSLSLFGGHGLLCLSRKRSAAHDRGALPPEVHAPCKYFRNEPNICHLELGLPRYCPNALISKHGGQTLAKGSPNPK